MSVSQDRPYAAPRLTPRAMFAVVVCGFVIALSIAAVAPVNAVETARPALSCELEAGPSRAVTRVIDGENLALDDGSEVKLLGILAPRALDVTEAVESWLPEREAIAALSDLVLGRTIELAFTKPRGSDRYGRLLAHAFVERDGHRTWVQGHLLNVGHARAHTPPDHAHCLDALLDHERTARESRLGLWANAAYGERAAYRTRELMRYRNSFQIVAGRLRSVAEKKGTVLLNFGRDWHDDFTVGIKSAKLSLAAADDIAALRALEGRRVRVRGWIERRNGPYIELSHARDLEVLDAAGGAELVRASPDGAATSEFPEVAPVTQNRASAHEKN